MLLNTMATAEAAAAAMPSTRPVMEKAFLNGIPPFLIPAALALPGGCGWYQYTMLWHKMHRLPVKKGKKRPKGKPWA